jgi:hypothetical protein
MRYLALISALGLTCAPLACDDGSGRISRYCAAYCSWQDECSPGFDDQWDSLDECRDECRTDTFDSMDHEPCRSEWLSYYTCYYEEAADDCTGIGMMEECDDLWDPLQDCWDNQHEDQHTGPVG